MLKRVGTLPGSWELDASLLHRSGIFNTDNALGLEGIAHIERSCCYFQDLNGEGHSQLPVSVAFTHIFRLCFAAKLRSGELSTEYEKRNFSNYFQLFTIFGKFC